MQDKYKNILVIVTGLLFVSWFFKIPFLKDISLIVGIASIFLPFMANVINWLWLKLAHVLGWINSKILLSIIYFVFLIPLALLSRLFTKDPLNLKNKAKNTLYSSRDHQYTKEDLENIW